MNRFVLIASAAALATSASASAPDARSLWEPTPSSCPTCSVSDLQYIFSDTKDLLALTKAAYEAKGQVWYAKDQYVNAGCEFYTSMIPWDVELNSGWGRRAEAVVEGSEYHDKGLVPTGVAPPAICAAKADAIVAARTDLETAISNVLGGIQTVTTAASGCGPNTGSHYYRALWETAVAINTFGPANINYLAACLDKFKFLLESLLSLEKIALAKASYAITLETKLAVALADLAACEATYGGYQEGYGYGASNFWGNERIIADEYYRQSVGGANYGDSYGYYRFSKCADVLATVTALQKESCYVQIKLVSTVVEMSKVGTMLAAKASKCFVDA